MGRQLYFLCKEVLVCCRCVCLLLVTLKCCLRAKAEGLEVRTERGEKE